MVAVEDPVAVVIARSIVTVKPVAKDVLESVGTLKRVTVIIRSAAANSSQETIQKST